MKCLDFTVKYLGHSSWVVEIGNRILVFDYGVILRNDNATFDFEKYKDKKVVLFFSHSHEDHYDRSFHRNSQNYNNVRSILGVSSNEYSNAVCIRPHENTELDGVKVFTSYSTDLGVSFLIVMDTATIFFAGDNAAWGNGDEANKTYYSEIDYIKSLGYAIDIAFVPVCTFNAKRTHDMTKGAIYAIDSLKPTVTFPMHANGNELLYNDFYNDYIEAGGKQTIICFETPGQVMAFKST